MKDTSIISINSAPLCWEMGVWKKNST